MNTPADAPAWLRDLLSELARGQIRSDQQLDRLAAAQTVTEQRLNELTASQARTDEQFKALAAAQMRTDERFKELAEEQAERDRERAESQARTDERFKELAEERAESQARTDERFKELAEERTASQARTDERFRELASALQETTARLDALAESTERRFLAIEAQLAEHGLRFERIEAELADHGVRLVRIEARLDEHSNQLGALTGWAWESRVRDHAPSFLASIGQQVRVLSPDALDRVLDPAVAAGQLSRSDAEEIRRADLVTSAVDPASGARLFVVVEVSSRVAVRDVERAATRARLLAKRGEAAIPVVVGQRIDRDAEAMATGSGVQRLINTED